MKTYKSFNEALLKSIKRQGKVILEPNRYIKIKHQDGSKFKIAYAKFEKAKVNDLACIIVYPEHNSVCVFMELDLDSVKIQPWKGDEYKLEIQNLDVDLE